MQGWASLGPTKCVRRFCADERAAVAVTFALAAIPLFVAGAALLDYSFAAATRGQMQSALDGAVIAGMKAAPGARAAAARQAFLARFPASRATLAELTINEPRNGETLTATARAHVATRFPGFLGQGNVVIATQAQARFSVAAGGGPNERPRACILLTDETAPQALEMRNGADIVGRTCEVHIRSRANVAAFFHGNTRLMVSRICIAGAGYQQTGTNQLGPIATNCTAASDPFVGAIPTPDRLACDHTDRDFTTSGASVSLTPGVYCGTTRFAEGQVANLAEGLYVVKGGKFDLPDRALLTGGKVTFYFADRPAGFNFSGRAVLAVSAPTRGVYRDVLMFEAEGLARSRFELTGHGGHALSGLIHLPSRNAVLRGRARIDPMRTTMVFNQLEIASSADMRINTSPRKIEVPGPNGTSPMIALSR